MIDAPNRSATLALVVPHMRMAMGLSVAVNLLFLVTPLYMLQIYDRVLTTGSVPTLLLLSLLAVFLMGIFLFADAARRRVLARAAQRLDEELNPRVMGSLLRGGLAQPIYPKR